MKSKEDKYKIIYNEAIKLLEEIKPNNIDMSKYFNANIQCNNLNDILYILLISIQDRQGLPNIIGLLKESRIEIFREILFDYDPKKILDNYTADSLLEKFSNYFVIKNLESKRNSWRQYAKSVISASNFISKFDNINEFNDFVTKETNKSPINLPILLKNEIFGLGFSLACNFLKDCGYTEYLKPDVHIKEIFFKTGICDNDEYEVFNYAREMAKVVGITPYDLDKLLWIVCSGDFHLDKIKVGANKDVLINRILEIIGE